MSASLCHQGCGTPFFVHVLGATILFGGVGLVIVLALASLGQDAARAALLRRLAFQMTLLVVWPALIAMRVGGQWLLSKYPGLDDRDPGWLGVGFAVGDVGVLVVALATLSAWLAYRGTRPERPPPAAALVFVGLASLYLAGLVVAMFAMSAKPGS